MYVALKGEEKTKSYEITDAVLVKEFPEGAMKLDLWIPCLADDAHQRVLDTRVVAPIPVTVAHDQDHGNAILHLEKFEPKEGVEVKVTYRVQKRVLDLDLDPKKAGQMEGRREPFHLYLRPERHVRVEEDIRKLATDVVKGEKNPLLQVKLIYDFVREKMRYDAEKQS